jgi:hypothetical protein
MQEALADLDEVKEDGKWPEEFGTHIYRAGENTMGQATSVKHAKTRCTSRGRRWLLMKKRTSVCVARPAWVAKTFPVPANSAIKENLPGGGRRSKA